MRRWNRRAGSAMALVIVGSLGWTCCAAMGDEPKIGRFGYQAAMASENAQRLRGEYLQAVNDLEQFDGFVKDDLSKAKDDFEAAAVACDKAADAWRRNDEAQAKQFWKQSAVEQVGQPRDVWCWRWNFRHAQIDCAPTEKWYFEELPRVRSGALPAFHAWVTARKAAAEAWGALAEAAVPGANPKRLSEMENQASAIRAEVEIAEWRYRWANGIEEWSRGGRLNGDDVKPQLEALLQAQEESAKLQQERFEQERRNRDATFDADARRRQAERDLQKAYNDAARKRAPAGK